MEDQDDFYRRADEMFELYFQGNYAGALVVTERLAQDFPDEMANTAFWRICLLAVDGKSSAALQAMAHALEDGMWWSEGQLRADRDLASLQGNPEFERMVAICRERHASKGRVSPRLLTREPAGMGPHPLLLALHGRSSRPAKDLRRWEPAVSMGWLLAMPQPSQLGSPNSYVWDDIERSQQEIVGHYETLIDQHPVDAGRVVLAGFSQGGGLALQMSLEGLLPVRGFLAVAPGKIAADNLDGLIASGPPDGLRGYIVVGDRDERYPLIKDVQRRVEAAGVPCELDVHPGMGHAYPREFENVLEKALLFLMQKE